MQNLSYFTTDQLESRIELLERWVERDRAEGRLPLAMGELEDLFEDLSSRLAQYPEDAAAKHP